MVVLVLLPVPGHCLAWKQPMNKHIPCASKNDTAAPVHAPAGALPLQAHSRRCTTAAPVHARAGA